MPITYKCPSCGAAMEFDSDTQKLLCSQCKKTMYVWEFDDTTEKEHEEEQQAEQQTEQREEQQERSKEGYKDSQDFNEDGSMKVYHCQSCGAELLADQYTSATICAFCGNPSLVEDRLEGKFQPSKIIPFKINRDVAKDIYKKWAKKGPLTPKTLSTNSTIEKISGVYVPFWLYDFSGNCQMNATAQRVRTERHGNTEYIYTDHYSVYRDLRADFEKIPADASEKMPDDAMDKLEPFKYEELEPFAMPYLSGYLSERYNYTDQDMVSRVKTRADRYITDMTRNTIKGYANVSVLNNNIQMQDVNNEYALLPVWMLNCRYQNKDFSFMLNGQTGKIVADRPISRKKAILYGIGIFLVTLIITMLGGMLFL